jgi:predicted phage tail protein
VSTNTEANYPLVYAEPPVVRLGIVYNPFMLSETIKYDLVYNRDFTLADYMNGLPEEVTWRVAYNGVVVDEADWTKTTPAPFSNIVIVRIPEGGSGGKSVLRTVALIAVMVAAFIIAPEVAAVLGFYGVPIALGTAIVSSAIVMAGSAIVNALLPPQALNPGSGPRSSSYGIDGPKNTAREGVPVPVIYGQFQVGGNITDCFTRNIGDDQYLFMRTVLNDGVVSDISGIQLNSQDITSFQGVEYRVNLGLPDDTPVSWFSEAIRMESVQQKVNTTGVIHRTRGPCDRLRVDVALPLGLRTTNAKSGNHSSNTVTLQIDFREMSDDGLTALSDWSPLPLEAEQPLDTSGGSGIFTAHQSNSAFFTLIPDAPTSGSTWSILAEYKSPTDTVWKSLGTKTGGYTLSNSYYNSDGGVFNNSGDYSQIATLPSVHWNISFPSPSDWEVRFTGGSVQDNTTSNPNLNSSTKNNLVGTANSLTVTRETEIPFRLTYQSSTLTRSNYELRIRRTVAESTDLNLVSQVWVTDVGEIDNENVSYEGTAMLSLKIKLTDQLSSQPTLTALVTGSQVNIYDDDGNITSNEWSANPADICLDILLNPQRGGNGDPTKVIWSKMGEWREFCATNNLAFNGVFDFVTTMWDALQSVSRVGHATFIPQGTRYTVAIDQAADPAMIFTGSNMYMDTFKKTWLGIDDRANEIQQQFYDKDDFFKQKTMRLPNVQAQSFAKQVKPASLSGFGITSITQATSEAEYQARQNSYIRSGITVDVPIEAVGLSMGDVALIQHDSSNYGEGVGGRLEAGSTTMVINLDRPVTMTAGSYTLLISTDALELYTVTVTSVVGNKVTVTGLPSSPPRIRRLIQGSHDVEVLKIVDLGTGSQVISVDDATSMAHGSATLWDTDIIEETGVVFASGEHTSVTLTTPLPGPPKQYTNFLFGQVVNVKQPYRLRTISGDDDLYRRTLVFVQYDERVYEPGSWGLPILSGSVGSEVKQVHGLQASWDKHPAPNQQRIKTSLTWVRPETSTGQMPYAGADIFYKDNAGNWKSAGSVSGATTYSADYNRGDLVTFKVVSFDARGNRANFNAAPTVIAFLDVFDIDLDPPTGVTTEVVWTTDATMKVSWTAPETADNQFVYRLEYKYLLDTPYAAFLAASDPTSYPDEVTTDADIDTTWVVLPISPATQAAIPRLDMGNVVVRVRAEKVFSASPWVLHGQVVDAPGLPIKITNLHLAGAPTSDVSTGAFIGGDAIWTWDDILTQAATFTDPTGLVHYWQDYRVDILDSAGVTIRTEYTASPSYAYTMGHNHEDSAGQTFKARRSFSIEVRIRSKQLLLSQPREMLVTNAAPATPTGIDNRPDVNGVLVDWDACIEVDYAGTIVWLGTTAGFALSTGVKVYNGKANGCRIVVTEPGDYYVRVGHYDTLDDTPENVSEPIGLFIPTLVIADLEAISASAATLHAEIDQVAQAALQVALTLPKDKVALEKLTNLMGQQVGTLVANETTQRVSGDTAIATVLALIGAKSGDGLSFIMNLDTVKASPTESFADRFTQISSSITGVQTGITNEATTRANADTAQATLTSLIGAKNGGGTAFILNTSTVQLGGGLTLASWKTSVDAISGNANAYADSAVSTAVGPGSATANSIASISASVGTLSGSVTTLSSVVAGVSGVATKYGVSLDVNGHVAGFVINNGSGAASSSFIIAADKFAIVDSSTGSTAVPFSVSGGYANFANPVTVFGAGTAKLIIGPAFGASSNLILWFGPAGTSVSSASVANAIFALDTSGGTKVPGTGGGFSIGANTSGVTANGFGAGPATLTTSSVTITPTGNTGAVSYSWAAIAGDGKKVTCNLSGSPTGATAMFSKPCANTIDIDGQAICTATDAGTGKTAQFIVSITWANTP